MNLAWYVYVSSSKAPPGQAPLDPVPPGQAPPGLLFMRLNKPMEAFVPDIDNKET